MAVMEREAPVAEHAVSEPESRSTVVPAPIQEAPVETPKETAEAPALPHRPDRPVAPVRPPLASGSGASSSKRRTSDRSSVGCAGSARHSHSGQAGPPAAKAGTDSLGSQAASSAGARPNCEGSNFTLALSAPPVVRRK